MPNRTETNAPATLEIFRFHPEQSREPVFQRYEVPFHEDWVVLDAINYIKDNLDGTLTYRWSCRMGVCGSCGMMINGIPRLSCATFIKEFYPGPIRVEPLANFPVHRDLVIAMDDFMDKLPKIAPWIVREREQALDSEYRQTPEQLDRYKQFSMCLNCMLCYAACPVYALRPVFLGPAAIALAQRYNLDSRDQGQPIREAILTSEHGGIWDCTLVGECTTVCPAHVDPAASIQQAKLRGALLWVKDVLLPWGKS